MMSQNQDYRGIPPNHVYYTNASYAVDSPEARIDENRYTESPDHNNSFVGRRKNAILYQTNSSSQLYDQQYEPANWDIRNQLPSRNLGLQQEDFGDGNGALRHTTLRKMKSKYSTVRIRHALQRGDVNANELPILVEYSKLTEEEAINYLRSKNFSLTHKRSIKAKITQNKNQKQRNVSCVKHLKYKVAMGWQHCKQELREIVRSVDLWHSHLKIIQGHFGSGVASYFFFLRWLFFLNLFGCIILVCFLVTPQLIWQDYEEREENYTAKAFTGKEIITGTGAFEQTVMYYGFYTPNSVGTYKMPEAYLFGSTAYVAFCLLLLSYSLLSAYRRSYIATSGALKNIYANKVFSGWDYSIEKDEAARLKSHSIYNELLELLANEFNENIKESMEKKLARFLRHVFINVIILGIIGGMAYLVYYLLENKYIKEVNIPVLSEMTFSLVVTAIAYTVPLIFSALSCWEKHTNKKQLYLNMIRIVVLRLVTLGMVTYFWFDKNADSEKLPINKDKQCWESELGQEVYRLMMVDLFCVFFFSTLVMELGRRIVYRHCLSVVGDPEFDIAQNTLDLIYTQMLTWVGFFYCPLLPLIALLKLVVIFYTKRLSVVYNCRPSQKPWTAEHANAAFLMFTLLSFLLTIVALGYSIIALKPSSDCGPFSDMVTRYDVVFTILKTTRNTEFLDYLFSPGVIIGLLLFLCVMVYYKRATANAYRDMIKLLRDQLILESKDKNKYLTLRKELKLSRKNTDCTTNAESMEAPKLEPLFKQDSDEYNHRDYQQDNINRSSADYHDGRNNFASEQPKPSWGQEGNPIGQRRGSHDNAYFAESGPNFLHRMHGDEDHHSFSQRYGSPFLPINEERRPRQWQGRPEPPPSLMPHAQGFQYQESAYSSTEMPRHFTPQRS